MLFTRGVGDSTDIVRKEMYTFEDLGGRSMTLRPEGTAPVARAYVEHGMHTLPQPVKLYYHSPMFRYESPQSGRYRQHYQLGVEAFGSEAPELDAEVIGVLAALYRELGLTGIDLRLNSMGCKECRPGYSAALREYLQAASATLCGECRERAHLNPLRTFDCKVPACGVALEQRARVFPTTCARPVPSTTLGSKPAWRSRASPSSRTTRWCAAWTTTPAPPSSSSRRCWGPSRASAEVAATTTWSPPSAGRDTCGVGFGTGVERILLAVSRSRLGAPAAARLWPTW